MDETGKTADETSQATPDEIDPYATVAPAPGDLFATGTPSVGDRFRILRPLARGGLGEVFVALDGDLGREVALKEIQDRHSHNPDSRARFLLEAEVTGRLEHPGIVPIYGMGQYPDGRPYYAMRLIRGETLQEAIARFHAESARGVDLGERILALRRLLGRFIEICRTINYAHGQSVLHRDIKPANVMLGPHGEVLVVDWGLAKVIGSAETPRVAGEPGTEHEPSTDSSMTQAGLSIGTPAFMSPEQAEGDLARIGPASDIYSLGAMLYQLLTGRTPIEGKSLVEVLDRVKKGEFPPPRQVDRKIPRTLEAICLKAMAVKPEDRYHTAQVLADDLERWMAGEATSAKKEYFPQRLWRWARRRPYLVFYAIVVAFCDYMFIYSIAAGPIVSYLYSYASVDARPYLALVSFLTVTVFLVVTVSVAISQVTVILGAGIGGIIGVIRGNFGRALRRGAGLGVTLGLVVGMASVLVDQAISVRSTFVDIYERLPNPDAEVRPVAGSELEKLQGKWEIVSYESDGAAPILDVGWRSWTIKGREMTGWTAGGAKTWRGTLTLVHPTEPKQFNREETYGPFRKRVIQGIYKFDGDRLMMCEALPEHPRPRSFATSPGSDLVLSIWRRAKP